MGELLQASMKKCTNSALFHVIWCTIFCRTLILEAGGGWRQERRGQKSKVGGQRTDYFELLILLTAYRRRRTQTAWCKALSQNVGDRREVGMLKARREESGHMG